MNGITNEVLYIGGLAAVCAAVGLAAAAGLAFALTKARLNARFDEEYGKK